MLTQGNTTLTSDKKLTVRENAALLSRNRAGSAGFVHDESFFPLQAELFHLPSHDTHTWCASLSVSPGTYTRLYSLLSSDELHRCSRLRMESDRRRYVIVHGVLREILARYLRVQPSRIRYEYNACGKPRLSREFGGWLRFNLSHSGNLFLVAIAANAEVGIDLELVREQQDFLEIASQFFSVPQRDHLRKLPRHLHAPFFFRCWTELEARLKSRGDGFINSGDGLDGTIITQDWSVHSFQPYEGYFASVAIEGCDWRISHFFT